MIDGNEIRRVVESLTPAQRTDLNENGAEYMRIAGNLIQHISDDYETDGEWDEFLYEDDFDPTTGPIPPGTAVRAKTMPGVICRVSEYRRDGMADIHIVGDDRSYFVDTDDLTVVDDDVCSCGQDGCGWA
jgi:hypothetical protein